MSNFIGVVCDCPGVSAPASRPADVSWPARLGANTGGIIPCDETCIGGTPGAGRAVGGIPWLFIPSIN